MALLAFSHIPKAAGTSICTSLRNSFGVNHCDVLPIEHDQGVFGPQDLTQLLKLYPRLKSIAGHTVYPWAGLEQVDEDIRFFMMVRDPIARAASNYQHAVFRGHFKDGFEEWISRKKYQNLMTKYIGGTDKVSDAISRMEEGNILILQLDRFCEAMVLLSHWFPDLSQNLPYRHANAAENAIFKNEILDNKEKCALLERENSADVELYEYIKKEFYPKQLEAICGEIEEVGKKGIDMVPSKYSFRYITWMAKQYLIYRPLLKRWRKSTTQA